MTKILFFIIALLAHATLFARDNHGNVTIETLAKTSTSWNGAPLPPYAQGTPEVSVIKVTIPPGGTVAMHKHPYMNAAILLSGELHVRSEAGDEQVVKAGEALVELVDTWHSGTNPGDVPVVIVVVYAGIAGQPVMVSKDATSAE